jgi:S1-C subfamily serine protease
MKSPNLRTLAIVLVGLIAVNTALFGLLALQLYESDKRLDEEADSNLPVVEVKLPADTPGPLPEALAKAERRTIEIFRQASPSVVFITTLAVRRDIFRRDITTIPAGTGSGWVWDDKGHIVTNFHVIRGADAARVTLSDQTSYSAKLVGYAADKDLAVLRIDAKAKKLASLPRGTSSNLMVGQQALAIGNPFGLDHTLSVGVVSGLGREIKATDGRPIFGVIQTDAAINPGNSGGPLLDSSGDLIGINTAIYSPSGASAGIGFAVPVEIINRIVPQLIEHGKVIRPGLGIRFDPRISKRTGVKGVLVLSVMPDSPADAAGIEPTRVDTRSGELVLGDVIIGMDDTPIASETDLYKVLDQKQVGDTVHLKLRRGSETKVVTLTLAPLK